MDRFIDLKNRGMCGKTLTLKSNMDRFIVVQSSLTSNIKKL